MGNYERYERLAELLGAETILSEVYNYLNADERTEFIERTMRYWDIEEEEL